MVDRRTDGVSLAASALLTLGSAEALAKRGLGVVRVAELTGGDKGQVSRLLTALAEHGLVERDPDDRSYRLGWSLFVLAARAGDQRLVESARPLLTTIVDDLGERASLSVLRGAQVLTVYSEPSPRAVQAAGWVGRTVPAYCTSSGRALLLDHSREDLARLFDGVELHPLGPNSPRDVDTLYERIVASRARGFTTVNEEFEAGLVAAAAPVRDARGRICAALNASVPTFRLGGSRRLASAGQALKDAAEELSRRLGEAVPEPGLAEGGQQP